MRLARARGFEGSVTYNYIWKSCISQKTLPYASVTAFMQVLACKPHRTGNAAKFICL